MIQALFRTTPLILFPCLARVKGQTARRGVSRSEEGAQNVAAKPVFRLVKDFRLSG